MVGQRAEDGRRDHEGQPEPQRPIAEEAARALADQARPREDARDQEQDRHEEQVVEEDQRLDAGAAPCVDDRKGRPRRRRRSETLLRWSIGVVGERRVMHHDEPHDGGSEQISGMSRGGGEVYTHGVAGRWGAHLGEWNAGRAATSCTGLCSGRRRPGSRWWRMTILETGGLEEAHGRQVPREAATKKSLV